MTNNNLHFISIIRKALRQPDKRAALRNAFKTIEEMGKLQKHRRGYIRFREFISVILEQASSSGNEKFLARLNGAIESLILDLATGTFEGTKEEEQALYEIIASNSELREWYVCERARFEEICECPAITLGISVERNGRIVGSVTFAGVPGSTIAQNMLPGDYILKLSTGRRLWTGPLTDKDLVWTVAHPGLPFQMAADTRDIAIEPARELHLLGGEIVVQVFPGLRTGTMTILVNPPGGVDA